MTVRLHHLALAHEWAAATASGDGCYHRSTVELGLDEVGFIHCSFAEQVQRTADRWLRGRDDVVLLTIDPDLLDAEVRIEAAHGGTEAFPHLYGPLPVAAVVRVDEVPLGPDGRLRAGDLLR